MTSRLRVPGSLGPGSTSGAMVALLASLLHSAVALSAPELPPPDTVSAEASRTAIDGWIDRLGHSYEESTVATRALEEIGQAAVPALVACLGDAGDDLRWDLVNVLGALGSPRALEPLVEAAVLHGEVHARWRAYWAIAAVDDGRAIPLLKPYLEHRDPAVRWRAVAGLAFLEDPVAVPYLEEGLGADEEWRRWEAVNGLATVHREGSWRKVAALAIGDPEASVRQEAVMTLWKMGEGRARDALRAAAEDPSPQVRWRALAALAEVAPELAAWARTRAAKDPAPEVRETFDR